MTSEDNCLNNHNKLLTTQRDSEDSSVRFQDIANIRTFVDLRLCDSFQPEKFYIYVPLEFLKHIFSYLWFH